MAHVAVLGSGVAGLGAALALRAAGCSVTVLTHRPLQHSVSWVAGTKRNETKSESRSSSVLWSWLFSACCHVTSLYCFPSRCVFPVFVRHMEASLILLLVDSKNLCLSCLFFLSIALALATLLFVSDSLFSLRLSFSPACTLFLPLALSRAHCNFEVSDSMISSFLSQCLSSSSGESLSLERSLVPSLLTGFSLILYILFLLVSLWRRSLVPSFFTRFSFTLPRLLLRALVACRSATGKEWKPSVKKSTGEERHY